MNRSKPTIAMWNRILSGGMDASHPERLVISVLDVTAKAAKLQVVIAAKDGAPLVLLTDELWVYKGSTLALTDINRAFNFTIA